MVKFKNDCVKPKVRGGGVKVYTFTQLKVGFMTMGFGLVIFNISANLKIIQMLLTYF